MRSTRDVETFVTAPVGYALLGANHVIWSDSAAVAGTVVWGRIDEREAAQIATAWDYEAQLARPYNAVVDLAELETVDPLAFEVVARNMATRLQSLGGRIGRQALVRPQGMLGMLVAGFYPVLGPTFEWRDFPDRQSAYEWCWPKEGARLWRAVEGLCHEAKQAGRLVERTKSWLAETYGSAPTIGQAASALQVSTRSLQRALKQSGTDFRTELQKARVAAARAMLEQTELKIEAVAYQVGLRSATSFVALFERHTGQTPAAFRSNRRRRAPIE